MIPRRLYWWLVARDSQALRRYERLRRRIRQEWREVRGIPEPGPTPDQMALIARLARPVAQRESTREVEPGGKEL
jgi:hypothetical protein